MVRCRIDSELHIFVRVERTIPFLDYRDRSIFSMKSDGIAGNEADGWEKQFNGSANRRIEIE